MKRTPFLIIFFSLQVLKNDEKENTPFSVINRIKKNREEKEKLWMEKTLFIKIISIALVCVLFEK